MNIPPYRIFSNQTLIEIALKKPKTFEEMFLISGVGKKKLSKFGDQFLKLVNGQNMTKMHPIRRRISGKPNAWLYDVLLSVINEHSRGSNGLAKPLYVSPSLIAKILERQPKKISDLQKINGMTSQILERYGKPLIEALQTSN